MFQHSYVSKSLMSNNCVTFAELYKSISCYRMQRHRSLQRLPLIVAFLPLTVEETEVWATCRRQSRGLVTLTHSEARVPGKEDLKGAGSLPASWPLDDYSHTVWGPLRRRHLQRSPPWRAGSCRQPHPPSSRVTLSTLLTSLRGRLPIWKKMRPTATVSIYWALGCARVRLRGFAGDSVSPLKNSSR